MRVGDLKRFHSKIDLWLIVVLVLTVVMQVFALAQVLPGAAPMSAKYMLIASTMLVFSLIGSILFRTHYTIDGDSLRIVSGPFFRNVSVASITSVSRTRNPLSSPALSLDRLKIKYGNGRSVMISPEDQKEFLQAIGKELD